MKCMKKQSQHVNIVLLSDWKWLSPSVKSIRRGKAFFEVTGEGTFHVILFLTSSHIILNRCMTVHCLHWENKTSSACTDQLAYYVWLLSETRSSTWIIKAVLPEDFCIWLNDTPWQNSGRTGFCKKVNCVFFSLSLSALSLLGTVSCPGVVQLPLPPFRSSTPLTKIQLIDSWWVELVGGTSRAVFNIQATMTTWGHCHHVFHWQ